CSFGASAKVGAPMHRWIVNLALSAALIWGAAACDDTAPPPAEAPTPKPAYRIDPQMVAHIRSDRRFTVTGLVFVLQPDGVGAGDLGLSLVSAETNADGSRLVFGTFERASSLEQLAQRDIDLASGPHLNLGGNGVFTTTTAYQPKFARLRITAQDDEQVSGTISGEFYRFDRLRPYARPRVIDVDITFVASLYVK
ncbi:MAG: hypothetical protein ACE5E1_10745, partial [Phycisphaerae bacterium]